MSDNIEMTDQEVIADLKRWGHLAGSNVTWDNIHRFSLTDHEVEVGLASYQKYFAPEYERIAIEDVKGEPAAIDGKWGPVTAGLVKMDRCGHPDFFDPDNPLCAGTEDPLHANWPGACRTKLRFGRSFANLPGLTREQTDLVFDAACRIISRAVKDIEIVSVPYGQSTKGVEVFADLKRLGGSTLAWSYLARNLCGIVLQQAYDSGRSWSIRLAITVAVHEILHAMGSPHVNNRSATMFPSIHQLSLSRYGWLHAADLAQMVSLGYEKSGLPQPDEDWVLNPGKPDPPTDPDDPDKPDPPDGPVTVRGEIEFWVGDKLHTKIIPRKAIEIL